MFKTFNKIYVTNYNAMIPEDVPKTDDDHIHANYDVKIPEDVPNSYDDHVQAV